MKPRILVLPLAAAVIFGLTAWRLGRESQQPPDSSRQSPVRRLAPRFELYDQHSQLVKFERYLGRTRILLLFVGNTPAAEHPLIDLIRTHQPGIKNAGVQIVAVGSSTPYANRAAEQRLGGSLPFPVLSDVSLTTAAPAPAHRRWGLAGDDPEDVREGLFLIDRDGTVDWSGDAPRPCGEPPQVIEAIAGGDWPN